MGSSHADTYHSTSGSTRTQSTPELAAAGISNYLRQVKNIHSRALVPIVVHGSLDVVLNET
jgi:hypothetical protein